MTSKRDDAPTPLLESVTGGRVLERSAAINLAGQAIPLVTAAVALTVIARELDASRFGILLLAWSLVGYFSVFDLGFGRTVTWSVAQSIGGPAYATLSAVVWPAVATTMLLGALVGGALLAAASPLVDNVLNVPADLRDEATAMLMLLAGSLPFVTSTPGVRGVLEAHQRFGLAVGVRIPAAALTYLGSMAVIVWVSHDLTIVGWTLLVGRVVLWAGTLAATVWAVPVLRHYVPGQRGILRRLVRYGGWVSLSNVIYALLGTVDRFFVSAILTVRSVPFYATPQELVMRLLVFPGSLVQVVFPAVTTAYAYGAKAELIYRTSMRLVLITMILVIVPVAGFGYIILDVGLGSNFAERSQSVLSILCIALFFGSLTYVPHSALQALGRPRVGTVVYAIEFPVYLAVLWLLISTIGIEGAALAAALRGVGEFGVFTLIMARSTELPEAPLRDVALAGAGGGGIVAAALLPGALGYVFAGILWIGVASVAFRWLMQSRRAASQKRLSV
jgi:O-antigen/teichoic acid export membrane protein